MRVSLFCVMWVALCSNSGAQTVAVPPGKASRSLTPAQLSEHLQKVKDEILPKVMTEKTAADPLKKKKYLGDWQTVTSDHYLLFTNGPQVTCQKYAVSLERVYASVKKEMPFEDIDSLLTCYIFASKEEYYAYSVAFGGFTDAQARATAGHATAKYYATYYESPTSAVVYHEATHQVVGACVKVSGVGSWFQEGLAVYFEKKLSGEKPAGVIKNDLKNHSYYPLQEFIAIPELLSYPKGNGRRSYMHAGALLDFMINTKLPPVAGKFDAFLKAARAVDHQPEGAKLSEKLVQDVYGLSVPALEELWREHAGAK